MHIKNWEYHSALRAEVDAKPLLVGEQLVAAAEPPWRDIDLSYPKTLSSLSQTMCQTGNC